MIILYLIIAIVYCLIFEEYIYVDFTAKYTLITISTYLVSNVLYFRKKKNIINFEFFFAISFFAACFLTYFILEEGVGFAFFAFSTKPISLVRGIALAMTGYHFYLCGLLRAKEINPINLNNGKQWLNISRSAANWANWICLLTFCCFLAMGGMSVLYIYSGEIERENANIGLLLYWILTYSVSIFTSFASVDFNASKSVWFNILKLNKLFLINSTIIVVFLFISGYRSQLMQIVLPLFICYNVFIKKISIKVFFTILLCGMALMIVIGMTRSGEGIENNVSTIHYFRDFNAANASLGFFVDEVERKGITGGSNYIQQALSIVPFLQSIIGNFVDFNSFALPSSRFYTGAFDKESGFGTNIIGDIYYTFGLMGVVIIMYIVGLFCSSLSSLKNKYIFLMYLIFTGNSIFMARVELLYVVRMLALGCILLYVVNLMSKKKYIL